MFQRNLNALVIIILGSILLSAFGVQFVLHEQPCPLCLLQRLGMFGVAAGAAMNVFFNIRMSHYAVMLLSSIFGGFVALRQISLHICPGFSEFGVPVLGISLYTWSFFIFVSSITAVALLLFLYNPKKDNDSHLPMSFLGQFSIWFILLLAIGNILATFAQCGFGPCED